MLFTSSKMADGRRDTIERFLRAFRKGAHEYHDAFTGPGETRADQPTADAVAAVAAKYPGVWVAPV